MRDRKGVDLDAREVGGKEPGGVEGGETVIRIYYVRKKNLFSIKGKKETFSLSFSEGW